MWARIKKFVRDSRFSWVDFTIMMCIGFTMMAVTHTYFK